MARVVVVHGIGQEFAGPERMRTAVVRALAEGFRAAGLTSPHAGRAARDAGDVACAYYADLYAEPGTRSADALPPWDETDVEQGLEAALLGAWCREAETTDASGRDISYPGDTSDSSGMRGLFRGDPSGRPDPSDGAVPRELRSRLIRQGLDTLAGSPYFDGAPIRLVVHALKQFSRYLAEPELRAAAQARLEERIGPDTRVVVAHSLGSLIAYETLCARPDLPVTELITLGSPLGMPTILDRVSPRPAPGTAPWPGTIRHWTNVTDRGDLVAVPGPLAPRFGPAVTDLRIDAGARLHGLARYLSAPETAAAIARGRA
ncbi:antibiotic ABC transporter ATP-binding protein [Streptomyces sp. NPDC085481]|uniref:antibiotic ABC transporter ATP-binding protein n=1 Tax=Streptomyces sp. NPDC085481 TaxID=3365727 RepID=UPI0037D28C12